jgi:flagellar export protein FliJ
MSSRRPSQLQLVRGLAERREQLLAGEVGELMRQRAGADATSSRLRGYLDEYAAAPASGARHARTPGEIDNERRFVGRLADAIEQQRVRAERLARRAGEKVELWQRARANLEALDRVLAQRERGRQRDLQRREQRDSDALTARRAATEVMS